MAIVKIQHRRGNYADYDPSKVLPGELVVTQADDPNSSDGEAVYIATTAGNVKRLAVAEELHSAIETALQDAIPEVVSEATQEAEAAADRAEAAAQTLEIDTTLTKTNQAAEAKAVGDELTNLKSDLKLLTEEIPNTVQSYTFTGGAVSRVTHTSGGIAIRTDTFSYETNSITEVRTLNTGESLTIVTNLTTLETTVTYAAA